MKLVTSNLNKLAEFKRFGLDLEIAAGLDLREVKADSEQVAIYKAIEAGENLLVEDTILTIDGEEIVDIRKRLKELPNWEGKQAIWKVSIACFPSQFGSSFRRFLMSTISSRELIDDEWVCKRYTRNANIPFLLLGQPDGKLPKVSNLESYDPTLRPKKSRPVKDKEVILPWLNLYGSTKPLPVKKNKPQEAA